MATISSQVGRLYTGEIVFLKGATQEAPAQPTRRTFGGGVAGEGVLSRPRLLLKPGEWIGSVTDPGDFGGGLDLFNYGNLYDLEPPNDDEDYKYVFSWNTSAKIAGGQISDSSMQNGGAKGDIILFGIPDDLTPDGTNEGLAAQPGIPMLFTQLSLNNNTFTVVCPWTVVPGTENSEDHFQTGFSAVHPNNIAILGWRENVAESGDWNIFAVNGDGGSLDRGPMVNLTDLATGIGSTTGKPRLLAFHESNYGIALVQNSTSSSVSSPPTILYIFLYSVDSGLNITLHDTLTLADFGARRPRVAGDNRWISLTSTTILAPYTQGTLGGLQALERSDNTLSVGPTHSFGSSSGANRGMLRISDTRFCTRSASGFGLSFFTYSGGAYTQTGGTQFVPFGEGVGVPHLLLNSTHLLTIDSDMVVQFDPDIPGSGATIASAVYNEPDEEEPWYTEQVFSGGVQDSTGKIWFLRWSQGDWMDEQEIQVGLYASNGGAIWKYESAIRRSPTDNNFLTEVSLTNPSNAGLRFFQGNIASVLYDSNGNPVDQDPSLDEEFDDIVWHAWDFMVCDGTDLNSYTLYRLPIGNWYSYPPALDQDVYIGAIDWYPDPRHSSRFFVWFETLGEEIQGRLFHFDLSGDAAVRLNEWELYSTDTFEGASEEIWFDIDQTNSEYVIGNLRDNPSGNFQLRSEIVRHHLDTGTQISVLTLASWYAQCNFPSIDGIQASPSDADYNLAGGPDNPFGLKTLSNGNFATVVHWNGDDGDNRKRVWVFEFNLSGELQHWFVLTPGIVDHVTASIDRGSCYLQESGDVLYVKTDIDREVETFGASAIWCIDRASATAVTETPISEPSEDQWILPFSEPTNFDTQFELLIFGPDISPDDPPMFLVDAVGPRGSATHGPQAAQLNTPEHPSRLDH